MSDEEKREAPEKDEARDSKDDEAISKLLKRSLASDVDVAPEMNDEAPTSAKKSSPPPRSLLPSVQRKLRERSKGKFYRDGWSTSQSKINYALIAILMLFVIAVCYVALGPTGFSAH